MKIKKIICIVPFRKALSFLLLVGLLTTASSFAQDIHFSQFDETSLQLNPADAGVQHDIRAIVNYKNQWQSVASPYKTFAFSGDMRLLKSKKNHLGIGIDFFSDKAGDAKMASTQANFHLSGIIKLTNKSLLSGGLMAGYAQRSINLSELQWGNQYNGLAYDYGLPTGETSTASSCSFADLGAGVEYSFSNSEMYISANDSRTVTIGASVFHPHQPAYSYYGDKSQKLFMKIALHGDASIGIKNTNVVLKPSYMILIQGPTKEITPGLALQYILQEASKYTGNKKPMAISIGGYYRLQDAIIAVVKFEYANYAVGLSYDINVSGLTTVSKARGGFEVSLRFIAPSAFEKRRTSKSKF